MRGLIQLEHALIRLVCGLIQLVRAVIEDCALFKVHSCAQNLISVDIKVLQ